MGLQNEQGFYDYQKPALEARAAGKDSFRIRGTRLLVPYAHVAEGILVCARVINGSRSSGSTLFKVKTTGAGIQLTPLNTLTGEKYFAVTFNDYPASAEDVLGSPGKGAAYVEKVMPKLIALKCGEMVGGLSKVRATAVVGVTRVISIT